LNSILKLFLHRPVELFPLVDRVFRAAIDDCTDPNVRDTALFYYRLLRNGGVEKLKIIINHKICPDGKDGEVDYGIVDLSMFNQLNLILKDYVPTTEIE
jgi:hypothetical protein